MKTTRLCSLGCSLSLALLAPILAAPLAHGADANPAPGASGSGPVILTAQQDHARLLELLHIKAEDLRPGRDGNNRGQPNSANYDESKSNPFPNLPDPLKMKDGRMVTTPDMWWNLRRPEIVADMDSEVYGKVPAVTPKVTWEVTGTTEGMNGDIPIITKTLVGHVDNSAYPAITVNIGLSLTLPANAAGPSPVIMVLSGGGGGFGGRRGAPRGGGAPGAPGGAPGGAAPAPGGFGAGGPAGQMAPAPAPAGADQTVAAGTNAPGRRGGRGGRGGAGGGVNWQHMALTNGWGYATLNTGSIQADNGGGLTQGIIGLCNKGQPRAVDDWGVLRAWGWGASRAMDYFETDKAVNAKAIAVEGHSRWGKGTAVAMAYDSRIAIAYVSSSGEGGAHINRRDNGEVIGNLAGSGEYHWMAGNWIKYSGPLNGGDLPVDGHDLVAMCAPRPVFISGGANGDAWQDPRGMFMAADAAGPVYTLLGKKALPVHEMPGVGVPLIDSDIAFREHEQGHTDAPNWPTFLEFMGHYVKGPGLKPAADAAK